MSRNLVICLDGTNNEPETGITNVSRMYRIAVKDANQIVYYDPGVGTMGARSAITRLGRLVTRIGGLIIGYGVRENIEEAYRFLMHNYRPDDKVYLFGFSRGAYTARALSGLLRTVGLLRPGADNLIPYALKLYAKRGARQDHDVDRAEDREYWRLRARFADDFGNPDFPARFDHAQIHFLGVWDTVKTVGWLNWRAKFEQAQWPFTRKAPNVRWVRHAVAIDEWRTPYPEYRFVPTDSSESGRLREVWFAGVHSDVGGTFDDDHQLADIALKWMVDEAIAADLRVDEDAYRSLLGEDLGAELPPERALGSIHTNSAAWRLLGRHHRPILPSDAMHSSVRYRVEALRGTDHPYDVLLPSPSD